jgi:Holin of 3TMs, for gene-transfer release
MEWKDLAADVAKAAPILGGLLGGPAGAAVGGLIASALGTSNDPAQISAALATNPDAFVKLKQIESEQAVRLRELAVAAESNRLQAETAQIATVNTSIQAETKADHWPTYAWRPFIGFVTGCMIFSCYFVLPLLKIPVPAVPESVWIMLGSILGVASFWRGKAQADPRISTDNRG